MVYTWLELIMNDDIPAYRVIVFVPTVAHEDFIKELQDHIPSFLGPYDRVMWWSEPKIEKGTEQFRPLERSNPKEGEIESTVQKPSVRLEFLAPDDLQLIQKIIKDVIKPAHPFHDPVIYYERVYVANEETP